MRRWEKSMQAKKGVYESKGCEREGVGKMRIAWRRIEPTVSGFTANDKSGSLRGRGEWNEPGDGTVTGSSPRGAMIVERIDSCVSVAVPT
jgi:hypothetical protein